ncbi:MAG: hypothetical protein GY778_09420, partial [bacterium]|nr:hypothetical protein [bacterium]
TVVSPQAPLPAQPVWGDILTGAYTGTMYQVSVVFSETMDASSATNRENYRLVGSYPTAVALDSGGMRVLLTFEDTATGIGSSDNLAVDSTVRDINGRSNTSIAPMPISDNPDDETAPTIASIHWAIDRGPYEVVVTYSEVMDADTAGDPNAYRLGEIGALQVPSSVTLSPDGKSALVVFDSFLFNPVDLLDIDLLNTIPTDANGRAFAGGGVDLPAMPDQRPGTDVTGPVIVNAIWAANERQYRVIATFSEALALDTASTAAFYILDGVPAASAQLLASSGGTKVDLTFDYVFNRHATLAVVA